MNSKDAEPETPHWDFGRDVAQTVKLQIKLLLSYVDKTVKNKEEKRNRYLLPLKYLFCYAENSGLQDILKMDMAQEEEFTSLLRMHNQGISRKKRRIGLGEETCFYIQNRRKCVWR